MNLTPLLTTVSDAESLTGWSGPSLALETDDPVEGAAAIAGKVRNSTGEVFFTAPSTDLSTGDHVYIWVQTISKAVLGTSIGPVTGNESGIRMRLGDASNYKEWNLAGKNTYPGGWVNYVVDPLSAPDVTVGTPSMAAVTRFGVVFEVGIFKNLSNVFVDAIRVGTGLRVTGGTAVSPGTWDELATLDAASAYGIVTKRGGVFFLQGELIFGDAAVATDTYFEDQGQIVVFPASPVSSTLFRIVLEGHPASVTDFRQGTRVGSGETAIGEDGTVFVSKQHRIDVTAGANVDVVGLYGTTLRLLDLVDLSLAGTLEVVDCEIVNAQTVTLGGSLELRNSIIFSNGSRRVVLEMSGVSNGARCFIEAESGGPETPGSVLLNQTANGTGVVRANYLFTANQPVEAKARLAGFLPYDTFVTVTAAGLSVPVSWISDPNFTP